MKEVEFVKNLLSKRGNKSLFKGKDMLFFTVDAEHDVMQVVKEFAKLGFGMMRAKDFYKNKPEYDFILDELFVIQHV